MFEYSSSSPPDPNQSSDSLDFEELLVKFERKKLRNFQDFWKNEVESLSPEEKTIFIKQMKEALKKNKDFLKRNSITEEDIENILK